MRVSRSHKFWLALLLGGALLSVAGAAPDAGAPAPAAEGAAKPAGEQEKATFPPAPPLPELSNDDGRGLRVVVIPIHGTIDLGLAPFVKRSLEEARGAAVVILDVDTFGGRVDAAVQIRDALLANQIPTVAFVNRRAISAGALISLAADHIVFTSGGTMGAATPVQVQGGQAEAVGEKMVSYMRSEMRATAEAKDRPGILAEAMVDADVEVTGYSAKGKLLTVTTDTALATGLAAAEIENLDALLVRLNLERAEVVRPSTNWAERVARFLTDPIVSGLLMSIGMLGLLLEFYTPGFGLAGAVGLLCLMLFFGGHLIVDLAGWEEILLFVLGLIALGVEIFVIPGFGVVGIIGVMLIAASLVMAMLGLPLSTSWNVGAFSSAMATVLLSLAGTAVAMVLLVKLLPNNPVGRWLVLNTRLDSVVAKAEEPGGLFSSQPDEWARYLGRTGVTVTDLRPAGKARIDDDVVDVVARGEWIERGEPIRVVEVEGVRVVVTRHQGTS